MFDIEITIHITRFTKLLRQLNICDSTNRNIESKVHVVPVATIKESKNPIVYKRDKINYNYNKATNNPIQ